MTGLRPPDARVPLTLQWADVGYTVITQNKTALEVRSIEGG
jgi:hypothetical protein